MPSGEKEVAKEVIIFESVTRDHEGVYECVTDEDYGGEPVSREIAFQVKCK